MRQFALSQDELSLVLVFLAADARSLMRLRRVSESLCVAVHRFLGRGGFAGRRIAVETADAGAGADDTKDKDDTKVAVLLCRALEVAREVPPWLCLVDCSPRRVLILLARNGCPKALSAFLSCYGQQHGREDGALWLRLAARNGHLAVLECLAGQRTTLSNRDRMGIMFAACDNGHAALLDRLVSPPFAVGRDEAKALNSSALYGACAAGHLGVVDRLALPPFSLGREEAVACDALGQACANGHADVVDRLAAPPFSLGQDDARSAMVLLHAAKYGRAAVVARLALPPYSLEYADTRAQSHRELESARECARRNGHRDVLALFAQPPYAPYVLP